VGFYCGLVELFLPMQNSTKDNVAQTDQDVVSFTILHSYKRAVNNQGIEAILASFKCELQTANPDIAELTLMGSIEHCTQVFESLDDFKSIYPFRACCLYPAGFAGNFAAGAIIIWSRYELEHSWLLPKEAIEGSKYPALLVQLRIPQRKVSSIGQEVIEKRTEQVENFVGDDDFNHGRYVFQEETTQSVETTYEVKVLPKVLQVVFVNLRPAGSWEQLFSSKEATLTRLKELQFIGQELFSVEKKGENSLAAPTILCGYYGEDDDAPAISWIKKEFSLEDGLSQHLPRTQGTSRGKLWGFSLEQRHEHILYQPKLIRCNECSALALPTHALPTTSSAANATAHRPLFAHFSIITDEWKVFARAVEAAASPSSL
jgi:hypothetical protein